MKSERIGLAEAIADLAHRLPADEYPSRLSIIQALTAGKIITAGRFEYWHRPDTDYVLRTKAEKQS